MEKRLVLAIIVLVLGAIGYVGMFVVDLPLLAPIVESTPTSYACLGSIYAFDGSAYLGWKDELKGMSVCLGHLRILTEECVECCEGDLKCGNACYKAEFENSKKCARK